MTALAHPSLALVKYWGKVDGGINLPATTSIAITLAGPTTTTVARAGEADRLTVDGVVVDAERVRPILSAVRAAGDARGPAAVVVDSRNSFPTAAGLASSASGMAAYATAVAALHGLDTTDLVNLSRLARLGSGSASRSVFGGFTRWDAGADHARQIAPPEWWPELRVVILPVSVAAKEISSREAMNATRATSPYYAEWVADAPTLADEGEQAVARRDLERLGEVTRLSYLRMFATMLGANPPIVYWLPNSVAIQHEVARLRRAGIAAWETMDAGPQVKVLTTANDAPRIVEEMRHLCATEPIVCPAGAGVRLER